MKRFRTRSGFSMLEMLAVIAILSVASSAVLQLIVFFNKNTQSNRSKSEEGAYISQIRSFLNIPANCMVTFASIVDPLVSGGQITLVNGRISTINGSPPLQNVPSINRAEEGNPNGVPVYTPGQLIFEPRTQLGAMSLNLQGFSVLEDTVPLQIVVDRGEETVGGQFHTNVIKIRFLFDGAGKLARCAPDVDLALSPWKRAASGSGIYYDEGNVGIGLTETPFRFQVAPVGLAELRYKFLGTADYFNPDTTFTPAEMEALFVNPPAAQPPLYRLKPCLCDTDTPTPGPEHLPNEGSKPAPPNTFEAQCTEFSVVDPAETEGVQCYDVTSFTDEQQVYRIFEIRSKEGLAFQDNGDAIISGKLSVESVVTSNVDAGTVNGTTVKGSKVLSSEFTTNTTGNLYPVREANLTRFGLTLKNGFLQFAERIQAPPAAPPADGPAIILKNNERLTIAGADLQLSTPPPQQNCNRNRQGTIRYQNAQPTVGAITTPGSVQICDGVNWNTITFNAAVPFPTTFKLLTEVEQGWNPDFPEAELRCPEGSGIVGLGGATRDLVLFVGPQILKSLRIRCRPFNPSTLEPLSDLGTLYESLIFGNGTGNYENNECPAGTWGIGFEYGKGLKIDGISLRCQTFTGDRVAGVSQTSRVGGNGGGSALTSACAVGQVLREIRVSVDNGGAFPDLTLFRGMCW